MSRFCKVTSYKFHGLRLADGSYGHVTGDYHMVINKTMPTLLNTDDILMIVPDVRCITHLGPGWKTDYFSNDNYVIPNADDIARIQTNDERGKIILQVPPEMKSEVQFYKVYLKHAIPEGLGLNGVRYDQYIVIDSESWKHISENYLEGDNEF